MSNKKHIHEIPDWLLALPKNSMISSKDFSIALDLTITGFHSRIDLPQPCSKKIKPSGEVSLVSRSQTHYWKAVTVRNYIRKLIREQR